MDYIPIPILGTHHLLYLGILVFFGLLLFLNPTPIRQHRRKITTRVLIVSLLQQGLLYGYFIVFDILTLSDSLPLHLSRITSILGIIFFITKNPKLFSVIAYFSLFAWLSFLVPTDIQPSLRRQLFNQSCHHITVTFLHDYCLSSHFTAPR